VVVEINPATAKKLHLHDGDLVTIETDDGGAQARVHEFAGARPGMVFMPKGLGHSSFGFYLKGRGGNYNQMVEVAADPVSGLPVWGLTPVRVRHA
jgi:anaerobic selenocysteine-containing dehydrogenase